MPAPPPSFPSLDTSDATRRQCVTVRTEHQRAISLGGRGPSMYPVRRRVAPAIRCGPGEPGGDTDPTAHKVPMRVCDMRHRRLFGHAHASRTEALRSAASFLGLRTAARHAAVSRGGGDDDAYVYETYDALSSQQQLLQLARWQLVSFLPTDRAVPSTCLARLWLAGKN